jgi:penicillin-binding protein 1C
VIQITDAAGTVLDEVRIEVRGAGLLPGTAQSR